MTALDGAYRKLDRARVHAREFDDAIKTVLHPDGHRFVGQADMRNDGVDTQVRGLAGADDLETIAQPDANRSVDRIGDHLALRFGKAGERLVPVKLGAKLTEVGTLEIWADSKASEHRWRLQFELRRTHATQAPSRAAAVISEEALASAGALIPAAFAHDAIEPQQLPAKLEQTLGLGRNSWPVSAIRKLADDMLNRALDIPRLARAESS